MQHLRVARDCTKIEQQTLSRVVGPKMRLIGSRGVNIAPMIAYRRPPTHGDGMETKRAATFACIKRSETCFALILVVSLYGVSAAFAAPFTPTSDNQVLERLPLSAAPYDRELRTLRAALDGAPGTLDIALKLAQFYIRIGKIESDPRYYGYAQGVLQPWWNEPEASAKVRLLRAMIRQNRHDFSGALQDLAQVLSVEPGNIQAWLTRAVIMKLQANYDEARLSCLPLAESRDPLLAVTCLSDVNSLNGRAQASYEFLQDVLREREGASQDQRVWSLTVLAEISMRMGRNDDAERFFKEALGVGRQSAYLLAAYADFLLDQGRAAEVADLLADKTSVDSLLLRLALAKQQLAAADLPEFVAKIGDRFAASKMRGENFHQGDEARFALRLQGRAEDALRLAKANWAAQREPQDARVLLETSLAVRDRAAAQPVLDFLARTRLEHVRLKSLAAEIERLP
uniref:Tetratricopeptide repeat protein n=2 Tax=Methylocapsa acidiphila TaxID=133552 RepID=Q2VNN3_METAI|nr:hypothetical protein orf33 [Methylocapsa acidiphila]